MGPWMSQAMASGFGPQIHFVDIKSTKILRPQVWDPRPGTGSTLPQVEMSGFFINTHKKNVHLAHHIHFHPWTVPTSPSRHDFSSRFTQRILTGHPCFLLYSLSPLNACLLGPLHLTFFRCLPAASWQYCNSTHCQTHATAEQASDASTTLEAWGPLHMPEVLNTVFAAYCILHNLAQVPITPWWSWGITCSEERGGAAGRWGFRDWWTVLGDITAEKRCHKWQPQDSLQENISLAQQAQDWAAPMPSSSPSQERPGIPGHSKEVKKLRKRVQVEIKRSLLHDTVERGEPPQKSVWVGWFQAILGVL